MVQRADYCLLRRERRAQIAKAEWEEDTTGGSENVSLPPKMDGVNCRFALRAAQLLHPPDAAIVREMRSELSGKPSASKMEGGSSLKPGERAMCPSTRRTMSWSTKSSWRGVAFGFLSSRTLMWKGSRQGSRGAGGFLSLRMRPRSTRTDRLGRVFRFCAVPATGAPWVRISTGGTQGVRRASGTARDRSNRRCAVRSPMIRCEQSCRGRTS